MYRYYVKTSLLLSTAGLFIFTLCTIEKNNPVLPRSCNQIVLVLTDSVKASKGLLFRYDYDRQQNRWLFLPDSIAVVLGRNGLARGRGLHTIKDTFNLPIKKEGDGKSPAGIFQLSSVFGYAGSDQMKDLNMPYMQITDMVECIDDINSEYYNSIVERNMVERVDWTSSEKMSSTGIYYQLGVVIEHNKNPVIKGGGSCLFLHNWADPNDSMPGCTAMSPADMHKIAFWLDKTKNPLLIQLTRQLFEVLKEPWKLPGAH